MGSSDGFDGRLLWPEDPAWEEALFARVFNARRPERRPQAILVAGSVEDVQKGVRLARECGWRVVVRSGGHSLPVWSLQDGGLLIDLGALNRIDYDEDTQLVSCGPAALGGAELSPLLEARGRSFHGGHCPTVGLGGFLVNGGQGWNQRGWGWAAEAIVAVDVVTADGDLVRADADHEEDLYWAARGAGPAFPGIVVRFQLRTRPAVGYVAETSHVYALEDYAEVMEWLYRIHEGISSDVELSALSAVPPGESRRVMIVSALALVEDRDAAERALAPLAGSPLIGRALVVEDCRPSSMPEQRAHVEAMNPPRAQYISDDIWIAGETAEVIERLRPLFTTPPSPGALIVWRSNAPVRPLPDMAFSLQSEAYVAGYLVYDDPAKYRLHREWFDESLDAAAPVTVGRYIGDADLERRSVPYLTADSARRLKAIIDTRDPERRFASLLHDEARHEPHP